MNLGYGRFRPFWDPPESPPNPLKGVPSPSLWRLLVVAMVVGPAVGPRVTSNFPGLSRQLNRTSKARRSSHQLGPPSPTPPPPPSKTAGFVCGAGVQAVERDSPAPLELLA